MSLESSPKTHWERLLESCRKHDMDEGILAFGSYDTCGPESPVRNCTPGNALFAGVIMTFLGIPVANSVDDSVVLRDGVRKEMETGDMMRLFMKSTLKAFFAKLKGESREEKLKNMWTGKLFLMDLLGGKMGTDVYRDPALEILKKAWNTGSSLTDTHGWDAVRFPIVFHLQWDKELTKSGKPRMLFHTTFEPWRMAVGLSMALCGPNPPVQVCLLLAIAMGACCSPGGPGVGHLG